MIFVASQTNRDVPASFRDALASLRNPTVRPEVHLTEVPAPGKLAPFSVALSAEIQQSHDEDPLATGRFVVLHDPEGQESWGGSFRSVTLSRAELEPDIGHDPMLPTVAWSWVEDMMRTLPTASALGGTVTAVSSNSFGSLMDKEPVTEVEIRASWTTDSDVGTHFIAWTNMLCTMAGLPPPTAGVTHLRSFPRKPR